MDPWIVPSTVQLTVAVLHGPRTLPVTSASLNPKDLIQILTQSLCGGFLVQMDFIDKVFAVLGETLEERVLYAVLLRIHVRRVKETAMKIVGVEGISFVGTIIARSLVHSTMRRMTAVKNHPRPQ
jgi:hypothetical protein